MIDYNTKKLERKFEGFYHKFQRFILMRWEKSLKSNKHTGWNKLVQGGKSSQNNNSYMYDYLIVKSIGTRFSWVPKKKSTEFIMQISQPDE